MRVSKSIMAGLCYGTARDRRNQWRIVVRIFIWTLAWLAVKLGISAGWFPNDGLIALAAGLTLLPGIAVLRAYQHYLSEADELLRKIELDALALALGVGMIGGMVYWLMKTANILVTKDAFNMMFLLICVVYALAVVFGHRRYA